MTDPWAWVRQQDEESAVDLLAHPVSAIVLTGVAERIRPLLAAQSVQPAEIIVADSLNAGAAEAQGEWLWLFPEVVTPAPQALERLLRTAADAPRIGLIGPLMVQSQRRARVDLIESCGLTTTPAGRVIPAVEGGEPDQGQLAAMAVLGVDTCAALIRRDVWAEVAGVVGDLPAALAGVELGRRVNSLGRRVVAEPAARVTRTAPAEPALVERRTWELRLASAAAPVWTRIRLFFGCMFGALGFLLGKDAARAGAELAAVRRWLSDRSGSDILAGRPFYPGMLAGLTPSRRELIGRALDRTAGSAAEAWAELAEPDDDTSLDELTGDDFAARGRLRRLSLPAVAASVIAVLAVLAGWRLLGDGRLTGAGLLPSQEAWVDLVQAWLDPVAGQPIMAGPPWAGPASMAALATLGQVEWLVTLGFLVVVPVAWLLALRTLRGQGVDGPAAVVAALGYALAPVLVGALGGGWPGALAWAVVLPLLAHALGNWIRSGTWQAAGGVGLWLALAVAVLPLCWPLALLAMACVPAVRSLRGAGQLTLVAASGLVGLGPAIGPWWSSPGRFLTGSSPTLAPLTAPDPLLLLIAHPAGIGVAPVWVGGVVVGTAWLAALLGLFRRPGRAAPGFAAAALGLLAAIGLTRLVVVVPPGIEVRPQATEWLVLMVGGLILAAARGLAGLSVELRDRTLGARHAASLALTAAVLAAVAIGAGWWAWDSTTTLRRTQLDSLPPFVRVAMTSATPVRTLAIARTAGEDRWSLLEGDLPRLGEDERGLPGTVQPQRDLAESVVNRLLSGSADEQLSADLARLGVGYVWLKGSDPDLRTAIGNVPGLGVGTGDDEGATWPVPNSGVAVVEGGGITVTGDGQSIAPGGEHRRIVLAEVADPRWSAGVDGRTLAPAVLPDGRQAFELGTQGGVLRYGLNVGSPVWTILQLSGVLVLCVLAAPRLRRRS